MPLTHVFDFLATSQPTAAPLCALFGDEPFLRQLARKHLQASVLGDDADVSLTTFDGEKIAWADVLDELSTRSLFSSGPRLVLIDAADDFVSRYRTELEDYVAEPRASGVLVLLLDSWPSNTRLYKAVDQTGLAVACRAPEKGGKRGAVDEAAIGKWMCAWAKSRHDAQLTQAVAAQLLDVVGPEFGFLDQELARLALYTADDRKITAEIVREHAGGWRLKTTWEIIDLTLEGKAAEALLQFDRVVMSGESPIALFGPFAWSLKRFAAATRVVQRAERAKRRIVLAEALEQAGFRKWPPEAFAAAERQLKQLTRQRAGQLYRWLLETDLALKGTHSHDDRARLVMEQLITRLGRAKSG